MRQVEDRLGSAVAVIGVHSGKFTAEHETRRVAAAVEREGIDHPVVNDPQFRVWQSYAVRAWPTLVFIDTEGRVIGRHEGEATADELAAFLQDQITRARAAGTLRPARPPAAPAGAPPRELHFPAGIAADGDADRVYVADSGHHRILETDGGSRILRVFGRAAGGFADGPADEAAFAHPHGLAVARGTLYVADTGNHALRAVDLRSGRVTTLAGTGRLGRGAAQAGGPRAVDLRSPWDVVLHGANLFVAMAGAHQIWRYRIDADDLAPYAGSGYEALYDAGLARARFAQPMGLAVGGGRLYAADAESSAVRELPLDGGADVRTLVGKGLFDFGDRDGPHEQALLQHVSGIAWLDGQIYVTDTYNDKIRRVDPATGAVSTVADGFSEPEAIAAARGALFIADTNAHRVVRLSPAGAREVLLA